MNNFTCFFCGMHPKKCTCEQIYHPKKHPFLDPIGIGVVLGMIGGLVWLVAH